ncbi:hypothetical protein HER12_000043 [Spiroplasma platyhelix PALS-1]|uniref:Peptidase M60 domain-containing protein n=2 Tax=Spiroplasma platyhelix TaxID=301585 RepID=A0A846U8H1_9MOLU|nr:hypothetical protein [Spiroplasma platyhelix PALS-1]NKE38183.1 hypothetical protein [Spiroplasma platyhelix PALS-1]UJB29068.1 hypothetical protein SPLAT_v1c03040 [Spiroplasma platyhelix PALS-1]
MFWQLQMAFGDNFYPTLSQFYRTNLSISNMQQDFIKITSKITNRNLTPFYQKWGIKINDDTKKTIEQLPSLEKNIWENIINGTKEPVVELELPEYQLSTLKYEITSKKAVNFGTKIDDTNINEFLDISENNNILADKIQLNWMNYYIKENQYYIQTNIIVKDDNLLSNSYIYFIPVSFEDTISFIGYAYYQRGLIGLNQATKTILFRGTGTLIDASQNKETEYYDITIKNQNREIVKNITLKAGDNFNNVLNANKLWEIPYEEGFIIEVNTHLSNKARIFNSEKNTWVSNNKKYSEYVISNDKLVVVK